jgi:ankyrin repeat protein
VLRLLLEHGADANSKDVYGRTPLFYAAAHSHNDAEADESDDDEGTSAWKGNEAVVRFLLEHGAETDSKDGYGRTALSIAAEEGYETIVRLLLEHGADTASKCHDGRSPLSYATEKEHEAVIRLFAEYNKNEADLNEGDGRTQIDRTKQSLTVHCDEDKREVDSELEDDVGPRSEDSTEKVLWDNIKCFELWNGYLCWDHAKRNGKEDLFACLSIFFIFCFSFYFFLFFFRLGYEEE